MSEVLSYRCLGEAGEGWAYDKKVDLPQPGSPRRRMVTVGGSSISQAIQV